ncbi:hypothetical protein [Marinoscillum pacificum]|uniref:hypothetical protein n=1 Tax=Marinoscillum pacificum TaxID=392723 RepID=UPI0021571B18|nr:hypothetical protein [Marinoscillum pacificum]
MTIIKTHWKVPIIVLILFSCLLSCKDNDFPMVIEEVDHDMESATELVDSYLSTTYGSSNTNGRAEDAIDKIKKSITVIKFHKGELVYNTNTDSINGYQKIEETTITASVMPGEMIFWFSGAGINSLDSIDFDDQSLEFLDDLPSEIKDYKMWVVQVPDDYDSDHNMLKYDIVYESKDYAGVKVRLDPKIQIKNGIVDVEVEVDLNDGTGN